MTGSCLLVIVKVTRHQLKVLDFVQSVCCVLRCSAKVILPPVSSPYQSHTHATAKKAWYHWVSWQTVKRLFKKKQPTLIAFEISSIKQSCDCTHIFCISQSKCQIQESKPLLSYSFFSLSACLKYFHQTTRLRRMSCCCQ